MLALGILLVISLGLNVYGLIGWRRADKRANGEYRLRDFFQKAADKDRNKADVERIKSARTESVIRQIVEREDARHREFMEMTGEWR